MSRAPVFSVGQSMLYTCVILLLGCKFIRVYVTCYLYNKKQLNAYLLASLGQFLSSHASIESCYSFGYACAVQHHAVVDGWEGELLVVNKLPLVTDSLYRGGVRGTCLFY